MRDLRVPSDGSRVRVTGAIDTSVPGQVRLCLPRRIRRTSGPRPGVVTEGLDATLHERGVTTALGVLRGDVLVVEQQSVPAGPRGELLPVPCPEPDGGWAPGGAPFDDRSPDDAAVSAFHARHPGMVGRLRLLRPRPDRQVAVVLVANETERRTARDELALPFSGRLCIVNTDEDVKFARAAQNDSRFRRGMLSASVRMTSQWRQVAYIHVWAITDQMIEALADYPPGLVELQPFIEVVP